RRVSQISHQLKTLARVCDVPVIALSQLNRNVESRADRTPQLADLRQSGSLEQDADQVLLLFRYDYYVGQGVFDEDLARKNTCDVIVGKHRNGATGRYTLRFQPETMSFKEFSR
ncbi:MAG TPA: DnaB-like helicase C-terminal domain-containing protein, partial [Thermomicrobiales bacterium]|nr:DnaB-like helicase C-terminal domain-containing protein [Thermomicrobiales bacterium]